MWHSFSTVRVDKKLVLFCNVSINCYGQKWVMPQQGSWLQVMDSFQLPDPPLITAQREHRHLLPHKETEIVTEKEKKKNGNVSLIKNRLLFSLHRLFSYCIICATIKSHSRQKTSRSKEESRPDTKTNTNVQDQASFFLQREKCLVMVSGFVYFLLSLQQYNVCYPRIVPCYIRNTLTSWEMEVNTFARWLAC